MPLNILLILIDDLGWQDLSCYGSTFYETPNLDKLAAQGMFFTDSYAACPVCSPTRASILTGKYPATIGVTDWIDYMHVIHPCRGRLVDAPYIDHLPFEETSLAEALRQGGYQTWHVGKWHLGEKPFWPENHGFEVNIAGSHFGHPYNGYFAPWKLPNLSDDSPAGAYLTDRLTDEVIRLIEQRDPGRPFFLNLWHYAVHTPIQARSMDIPYFIDKARRAGLDQVDPYIIGEPFPTENKQHLKVTRRVMQSDPVYAAMVWNLDWNIGRVLAALDQAGLADNTLVIFTSDNGGLSTSEGSPTCNAPLSEGKGWMYEGGTREPLIIRWPGVVGPGSRCSVPVTSPDFYPTLLQAAGLPLRPEQHKDGASLLPLLKGAASIERDAIFWHYPHYGNQGGTPGCSIRQGDYKLIEFFEDHRLELYNLKQDPGEHHNLLAELPGLAGALHQQLVEWRVRAGGKLPVQNLK